MHFVQLFSTAERENEFRNALDLPTFMFKQALKYAQTFT